MKHKRLAAAVLAAALWLTGCGGAAAPAAPAGSGSAAASQSTGSSQNAPALATQKERITEQFTLEKTIRTEWGSAQKLTIHVPQLVCDSPDAAYLNDELAARYAAEYRDYESYPQAEVSEDEWCPQIYIDWDAYWYGDCVSLVVSSYYGGTDPIYSQGWCFDFAAGHKLSVTELLMHMGLDPDETQLAVYRAGAAGRRGQPAVYRRYGNRACPADRRVEQPAAGRFHRQLQPWGRGGLVLAGPEFRRQLPAVYPQQPLFLSGRCHLSGRYPGRHRAGILSYPRHRQRPGMGCVQRCIAV